MELPVISARGGLLLGVVVVLLGIITLGLSLGILNGAENGVWIVVGLIAAGGFGLGYLENRARGWLLIAAYVFAALSVAFGVWSAFGSGVALTTIILIAIALPFLAIYIASKGKAWQALFIAAIVLMTAQVALFSPLTRQLVPDAGQSALLLGTSFLSLLALIFVILWLPNRHDPHFAWAAYPPHVLIVLAGFFGLAGLGAPQLAIPALLLYVGGVLLLRYWLHLRS